MFSLTQKQREQYVFLLALVAAKLSFVAVVVLVAFEAYVRWKINKSFAFLSGFELETLTISTFILMLALAYLYRPTKGE